LFAQLSPFKIKQPCFLSGFTLILMLDICDLALAFPERWVKKDPYPWLKRGAAFPDLYNFVAITPVSYLASQPKSQTLLT
jgi:hypothetical protein